MQVYTGDGKGKTTAAVGLAVRAVSHGLKVCFLYFHKEPECYEYGEFLSMQRLGVDIVGFAKKHPHFFNISREEVRKECLEALKFVEKSFEEKRYDILIMDEVNIAIRDGFLKEEEILALLSKKPESVELILTGRGAPASLVEVADLVSRVEEVKHPYKKGIQRRKGIDF